jgi:general secretion pathway protein G
MKTARGFTLIEMLVTVAIVGLLAAITVPMADLVHQRGKERELREDLQMLRGALDSYKQAAEDGRIKTTLLDSGYPPSLQALVEGIDDARSPQSGKKIYFLRRVPRDPFADAGVDPIASWGTRSYESAPENPQSGGDVFDVYSLASGVGLNGVPYGEW